MNDLPAMPATGEQEHKFGSQSKNPVTIIRRYKASVKTCTTINKIESSWQQSFNDIIIRNDRGIIRFRKYISDNPIKWDASKNKKNINT